MSKITREEIQIISRFSNWKPKGIENELINNDIYADKNSWQKFIKLFLIGLGAAFSLAGIIFFFAYNWHSLNKFVKLGIVETLVTAAVVILLMAKNIDNNLRKILLTVASVLTGTIFMVYGQVYQTGADAYDLFLIWTLCITIWVVISDYEPLWLIYLILINTTIILYSQQVAQDFNNYDLFNLLFVINTLTIVVLQYLSDSKKISKISDWFVVVVSLSSISYLTTSIIIGIFDEFEIGLITSIVLATISYCCAIYYAYSVKKIFYIATIPVSIIFILTSLIINSTDNELIFFLFSGLFVATSFTGLVKLIIHFKKLGYE